MNRLSHLACTAALLGLTLGGCAEGGEGPAQATWLLGGGNDVQAALVLPPAWMVNSEGRYTHTGQGAPVMLPAYRTAWEDELERLMDKEGGSGMALADAYSDYRDKNAVNFHITKPPATAAFRTPAEYEASQAYILNWRAGYTGIKWAKLFAGIIQGAWDVVPVIMMTSSTSHRTWIETQLTSLGYSAADQAKNIIWWTVNSNAIWARDFGPVSVVETGATGKEKLSFIDYKYYHARPYDDEVPAHLAKAWGVNAYRPDLSFEGGNFQTTSDGLCSATKGVLYYNMQLSQSAVETILAAYQGCKKTIFAQPMTGGVIAHIDMFSKFGADDHMMVGQYTSAQDAANKAILDANAQLFANTPTPGGKTITVTRIPMPDIGSDSWGKIWRTYTNSLSLTPDGKTGVVLIPTYDDETSQESAAMAAYAKVFPGWKLVKIDSKIIIPGQGAIHCITMQIPRGIRASMEKPPGNMCGPGSTTCYPDTCGTVQVEGCCQGTMLKYCSKGKLRLKDCYNSPNCGWNPIKGLYDCGMQGKADPSRKFPYSCPGATTDAAPPADTGYIAPDFIPDLSLPDVAPDLPLPDVSELDLPPAEASVPDGGRGEIPDEEEEDGCSVASGSSPSGAWVLLFGLSLLLRRRRAA